MSSLMNTTAATQPASLNASEVIDSLLGDDGHYYWDDTPLADGVASIVSLLEERSAANPDPRFTRYVNVIDGDDYCSIYVYATFESAADRQSYESMVDADIQDEDPAFDVLEMPIFTKRGHSYSGKNSISHGPDSLYCLWFFWTEEALYGSK